MTEVDTAIYKHMRDGIKGGFDEERFASRIGFSNLKKCVAPAFRLPLAGRLRGSGV